MVEKRARMARPATLTDLLNSVFLGSPMERRLKEGRIWQFWDTAVGKQIAGRARPVSFRDGTLVVAVNSSPWMQQLTFLKRGIMEKLNGLLGEEVVRDIYLKAGAPYRANTSSLPPRRQHSLTDSEKRRVAEIAAAASDGELANHLASLYSRHLSLK